MPANHLRHLVVAAALGAAAACAFAVTAVDLNARSEAAQQRRLYTHQSDPVFRALLPDADLLTLTLREIVVAGQRSWAVDCTDQTGAYRGRATWDSATGCLVSISTTGAAVPRCRRALSSDEALECASGWAYALQLVSRGSPLYAARPPDRGPDTWHVDLNAAGCSLHVLLDPWTAYPRAVVRGPARGAAAVLSAGPGSDTARQWFRPS